MGKVLRIALAVLGLTVGAVGFLFAAMMMMIALFIVPGVIKNDSSHAIEVIPAGRYETTRSEVGRAPLYVWRKLPIPRGDAPLKLEPGETTTFFYDFDDINLCWLLVRDEGVWKVQPTSFASKAPCALEKDARGKPCCSPLPEEVQHVQPLETLVEAPPWLACVADGTCP